MTWVLRGVPGSERLIEYEAKLNRDFFPHYPCVAICQYDRQQFDPEVIKGVVMTHPLLVRGNHIYHDFYYIPPEEFLSGKRSKSEVEQWLDNIEREHAMIERMQSFADELEQKVVERTEQLTMANAALRREIEERAKAEATYHAIFDGVNDAIFIINGETGAYLDVNDRACELFGHTINEFRQLGAGDLSSGAGLSTKAHLRAVVADVWNRETPQVLEWEAIDKSGRVFWVESNITRAVISGQPCI